MRSIMQALLTMAAVGVVSQAQPVQAGRTTKAPMVKLSKNQLAQITAGSNAPFPPGQFPAGNPAKAPGNSNPNQNPNK